MRASPLSTVKRSGRSRGPWMAIGFSLLVLTTAVHWLATSPQTRPAQLTVASPQQATLEQAGLIAAEDTRLLAQFRAIPTTGPAYLDRVHGAPTVILTARPARYTLESLLLLGAAQRIDATTVTLINSVLVGPGAHLTLHAPATTLRMTSTPTGFTSLVGWKGAIELTGTADHPLTLTSWDPATNSPDQQIADGRAYLRVIGSALQTHFATLSHLGFWSGRTGGPAVTGSEPAAGPATPHVSTATPATAAAPAVASPTVASTPSPAPTQPISAPPPAIHTIPASPPPTVACNGPDAQEVSSSDQLRAALVQAQPGTVIHLRDGAYPGRFEITTAATADQPITLCGSRAAILDGGPIDAGYTLHLRTANHWRLSGFTIHGGQKGLMIDNTRGALIDGLYIHEVGDEAVHLRTASSDNTVRATTIRRTGLRVAKFGEGIYIGSARSNWCTYSNCGPDRSDRNLIHNNDIADTTSEAIDVKEGTSYGTLRANTLSGAAMTAADSWVDVKGNDWTITDNTGTDTPVDGFQTHAILDGWGERNIFHGNTATVNARGYAINITRRHLGNSVSCTNRATNAAASLSNIPCQ
ncbi:MAG: hypothetical protein ACRDRR_16045 [Pseudonocardiaceae bacterium]